MKAPASMLERLRHLLGILREPKGGRQPFVAEPRGLGDSLHNLFERLNIGSRVRSYFAKRRESCGCAERQARFNAWCLASPWFGWLFRWWYRPSGERPLVTVGMPHFADWEGAWGTIESTLAEAEAAGALHLVEILVVSQSTGAHDEKLKGFMQSRGIRSKFIVATEPQGTCPAKNAVFANASGEWVVLIDCHAAWKAGSLAKLLDWIKVHRFDGNLYGGVMELGIGYQWHRRQHAAAAVLEYHGRLTPAARKRFPSIPEAGIEGVRRLVASFRAKRSELGTRNSELISHVLGTDRGYHSHLDRKWSGNMLGQWATDQRAEDDDAPPFEVDNLAGWFLICRRDAWMKTQPYHPLMKGFGGEEGVNAWSFRKRGRKAFVLPLARAAHRFGRADAQGYSNTQADRIRNYALAFYGLGDTAELDRMRDYFACVGATFDAANRRDGDHAFVPMVSREAGEPAESWISRIAARVDAIIAGAIADHLAMIESMHASNRERHYEKAAKKPSDINEHVPVLRRLASECEHVTEMGTRHGTSSVAFLAAQPAKFVTIDKQCQTCAVNFLQQIKGATELALVQDDSLKVEIEETDLLFIDTFHSAAQVFAELTKHSAKVRKYITLHDTEAPYGYADEGGTNGGGIRAGIARWQETPDGQKWRVIEDHKNNHGLMVLGRPAT